jgi:hypothetical protein
MLQTSGVDGDPSIRAAFKQGARAARMIQMDVGEQNPVDGLGAKAKGAEGFKNSWNGILGRGINHCNTALLDHQMNRIKLISYVARVQCKNSIAKISDWVLWLARSRVLMKRVRGNHKTQWV